MSKEVVQHDQEPHRHPEWGRHHNVAVVQKKQDLENGRCYLMSFTVPKVAIEVAQEGLVKTVVEVLRRNVDGEDEVLGRRLMRPESVSVRSKA